MRDKNAIIILKKLFKEACISKLSLEDLLSPYYLCENGISCRCNKCALFEYSLKLCIVSKICRGCDKELINDDFGIWITYWGSYWAPSHKKCLDGMKEEAIACQQIDRACNDCNYFERIHDKFGTCLKYSKNVTTNSKMAELNSCFELRQ